MAILNAKAVYSQLLFKIIPNPTIKLKTESGIITNAGLHKSDETGDFEKSDVFVGTGIVTSVGPDAKYVKEGDLIFFIRSAVRPVPVGEELWNVAEQQLIAHVSAGDPSIEEAMKNYKEQTEDWNQESLTVKQKEEKERLAKFASKLAKANGDDPLQGLVKLN